MSSSSTTQSTTLASAIAASPLARPSLPPMAPQTTGVSAQAYPKALAAAKTRDATSLMLFAAQLRDRWQKDFDRYTEAKAEGKSTTSLFYKTSLLAKDLRDRAEGLAHANPRFKLSETAWEPFEDHNVLRQPYTSGRLSTRDMLTLLYGLNSLTEKDARRRGLASLVGIVPGVATISACATGFLLDCGKQGTFVLDAEHAYDLIVRMDQATFQDAPFDSLCVMAGSGMMNGLTFVLPAGTTFLDTFGAEHTLEHPLRVVLRYHEYQVLTTVLLHSLYSHEDKAALKMHDAAMAAFGEPHLPANADEVEWLWCHYFAYDAREGQWIAKFFEPGRRLANYDGGFMADFETFVARRLDLAEQAAIMAAEKGNSTGTPASTTKAAVAPRVSSTGDPFLPDFPDE